MERIHHGASAYSWDDFLTVACLISDEQAAWVLISGTWCDDLYSASGERYCVGKAAAAAHVPALERDPRFWESKGNSAPYVMHYQLLRWGVGHDCRVQRQAVTYSSGGDGSFDFWRCSKLQLGDALEGGDGTAPLKFHPFAVWTKSNQPFTDDTGDDPQKQLTMSFAIDEENYTYRFR